MCINLRGKNAFEIVAIRKRRQSRRVCRQSDRWQCLPLVLIPAHKLSRDMLSIGRASSIAAQKQLFTCLESPNDEIGAVLDRYNVPIEDRTKDVCMLI